MLSTIDSLVYNSWSQRLLFFVVLFIVIYFIYTTYCKEEFSNLRTMKGTNFYNSPNWFQGLASAGGIESMEWNGSSAIDPVAVKLNPSAYSANLMPQDSYSTGLINSYIPPEVDTASDSNGQLKQDVMNININDPLKGEDKLNLNMLKKIQVDMKNAPSLQGREIMARY